MLPNLGEKLTPRQTSGDGRSGRGSGPAPLDPLHEGPRVAALERRARELSRALADCETLLKKVVLDEEFRKGLLLVFEEVDAKMQQIVEECGREFQKKVDDVRLSTVGRKEFVKLSEAVAEETERCAWRHDLVLEQLRRKADTQLVNALLGERAEKVVLAGLQNQEIGKKVQCLELLIGKDEVQRRRQTEELVEAAVARVAETTLREVGERLTRVEAVARDVENLNLQKQLKEMERRLERLEKKQKG